MLKRDDWLQRVTENGWDAPMRTALDVLEPFGVLGAQVVWVLQPALGLFWDHDMIQHLAQTLEDPDGVDRLRQQLDNASDIDHQEQDSG